MLLVSVVEQYGYRVAGANERSTAAAILRATRPDLLIADVTLRGGNGDDLAKLAREMKIPVLLISGDPLAIERHRGRTTPRLLQKPFRLSELEKMIEELLRKRRKD